MYAGNFGTFIFTTVAVLGLPYIKPWSLRFGIPAICMVVAMVIFLSGSCRYKRNRPDGSPLTILLRVLVASASKFFKQRPVDVNHYYGVQEYAAVVNVLPPIRCWRCFEKAAIILPDRPLEQQKQNRWKLCALIEVRNAQYLIYMIPMAMAFTFGGLLSSLSHTYFIEQAKNMNHKVGSLTLPITVLFWLYAQARQHFPKLYFGFASCWPNARSYGPIIGIAVSMMLGVLCCITAASVESRRLDVVRKHGLLDKPDDTIPMSVFWLLPQYILLGAADGVLELSTAAFLNNYFILPWTQFMLTFTSLGQGLGCIGSVLCVYIVGKLSERGGNPSWFQGTLNESRLDKYYWTLAWLIASNIVPYIVLRFWYAHMRKKGRRFSWGGSMVLLLLDVCGRG
ncbi:Protein NRT1/PTR FAMILY 5.5 [Abeliophyllum distichum]|uniref:Protein NRT1/PTR FAMILY 5.5 n=1 Tax=Abeliophyllum distichum TaxID=126358 RepID=A0ABD1QUC8_9LAMI